jgi:hypothetical protein
MPVESSNIELLDDIQLDMDMETITLDDFELDEFGSAAGAAVDAEALGDIDQMNVQDLNAGSMEVGNLEVSGGAGGIRLEGAGAAANISGGPVSIDMGSNSTINITGGASITSNAQKTSGVSAGETFVPVSSAGTGAAVSSAPVNGIDDVRQMLELEKEGEFAKLETIRIIERTPEPELPDEQFSRIHRDLSAKNRALESSPIFDSNDPIISIDGSDLDRILYGNEPAASSKERTVGNVPVVDEPVIMVDEQLIPTEKDLEMDNLLSTSAVDTGNFELIVEDSEEDGAIPSDVKFALEPTEVVRDEQEKQVAQASGVDLGDFQFDLSAIPDVSESDEDEPIALSMDELNNIDVSEDNVVEFQNVESGADGEGGFVIAESGSSPEESVPLEFPQEEEIRMSEQSLEQMALSEENEDIGHRDVTKMIEISEPEPSEVPGTIPIEGAPEEETVEISLEELNEIGEGISQQEVTEGAYGLGDMPLMAGPEVPVEIESVEAKERVIDEKIDTLSLDTKDELKAVLSYLDGLLENLPEEKIKQFAKSEYYDLYVKILDKLGI